MEVIFLLGAAQAFFLSVLVFNKKGKSHGDYVLGSWIPKKVIDARMDEFAESYQVLKMQKQ